VLEYEYNLVGGQVTELAYQRGKADQFYYNYLFDADGRLEEAYSSLDGVIWNLDARYVCYMHGPLARVELGENQVQGLDYAYTLQGWLKGLNSAALTPETDMGRDGLTRGPTTVPPQYESALNLHE